MKYTSLIIFVLNLISFQNFGQGWSGKWKAQNPTPTLQEINRIFFLNAQVGYATTAGSVLKTQDSGESWRVITENPIFYRVTDLDFATEANGCAIVEDARRLISTSNGGASWVDLTNSIEGGDSIRFNRVEFTTPLVGFAFGYKQADRTGRIYRSENSGKTWTRVASLPPHPSLTTTMVLRDVEFTTPLKGWVIGELGYMGRTLNGGKSWITVYPPGNSTDPYTSISFVTDSIAYMSAHYALLRTEDRGFTWRQVGVVPFPPGGVHEMDFQTDGSGWMCVNGNIAYTKNKGRTWTYGYWPVQAVSPTAMPVTNGPGSWLFGGQLGRIYKTTDSGRTFRPTTLVTTEDLYGVSFSGDSLGWAVGQNETILNTRDGGTTWRQQHVGSWPATGGFEHRILNVTSRNDTAWAVGNAGLFHTFDGGNTWAADSGIVTGRKVSFVNASHGWVQAQRQLYETTDGGAHWASINESMYAREIYFLTDTRAIGLGSDSLGGQMAESNDGGRTWRFYYPENRLAWVHYYLDSLNGWLWTSADHVLHTRLLRTRDGGRTWTFVANLVTREMTKMWFADTLHGWAQMNPNWLYSTSDGGQTWEQYYGDVRSPDAMWLNPSGNCWAVQALGGIAHFKFDSTLYQHNTVRGSVIRRRDQNCVRDGNEHGLAGVIIKRTPGDKYVATDASGNWAMKMDSGTFNLSMILSSDFRTHRTQACPDSGQGFTVSFDSTKGGKKISDLNFFYDEASCPMLAVYAGSGRRRPCFPGFNTIDVRNTGKAPAEDVTVYYQMSPHMHLLSANWPYVYDSTAEAYKFFIGHLEGPGVVHIQIQDSATCDLSLMGQQVCSNVRVTPGNRLDDHGGCIPVPVGYDGSDISIRSFCRRDTVVFFSIRNNGNAMRTARAYRVFLDTNLVTQSTYQLAQNDSIVFGVPRSQSQWRAGLPLRVEADQDPRHPFSNTASAEDQCYRTMPGRDRITGDPFPQNDESPVVATDCKEFVGSSDPNDKLVSPKGVGPEGKVRGGTKLDYHIRFQNVGTDTAYKVVVVDTLPPELDITTLELGTYSHAFTYTVSGEGRPVLIFTFKDIDLVDSLADEPHSHGFLSFQIRPLKDLPIGTVIRNKASIYFDYNDPIVTPPTTNTIYVPEVVPRVIDSVVQVISKDLVAQNSPQLSPAIETGCDNNIGVATYIRVANHGVDTYKAQDTVTISLRDAQTGTRQVYRLPLGKPLGYRDSISVAVPFAFTDVRNYRLWARVHLPNDANQANDSTLVDLPYGALLAPHVFAYDTCSLGLQAWPIVRGAAFEAVYNNRLMPNAWSIIADTGLTPRQAYCPAPTDTGETTMRIITLPVGPLGRHPMLLVQWRAPIFPRFLPGDHMSLYARTVCGGRIHLRSLTMADSAHWPQEAYGVTHARMDSIIGLGPDSIAAMEVELHLMPGSLRRAPSPLGIYVKSISVVDSVLTASRPIRHSAQGLQARPNPARHMLTVIAPQAGIVELLSLQGKRLQVRTVRAGEPHSISLQYLPPGMYILRQQEHTLRIVKE